MSWSAGERENHLSNPLANLTSGSVSPRQGMGPVPVSVSIEVHEFDFLEPFKKGFATFLPVRIRAIHADRHAVGRNAHERAKVTGLLKFYDFGIL